MFCESSRELDALLGEARRLCQQQVEAAGQFGRGLRLTHFGLYLAAFGAGALALTQAAQLGWPVLLLLGLALGITAWRARAAGIALHMPQLQLPQMDFAERAFALRALAYRSSLHLALWLDRAHAAVLRLRATGMLTQFRLPQFDHITRAFTRTFMRGLGAGTSTRFFAGGSPAQTEQNLISTPNIFAMRMAAPHMLALLC